MIDDMQSHSVTDHIQHPDLQQYQQMLTRQATQAGSGKEQAAATNQPKLSAQAAPATVDDQSDASYDCSRGHGGSLPSTASRLLQ